MLLAGSCLECYNWGRAKASWETLEFSGKYQLLYVAGSVPSFGGLIPRQGQGVAQDIFPLSTTVWWAGLPDRDTPRQQLVGCLFARVCSIQSYFWSRYWTASLCHSSTDLAKPWARRDSSSHLPYLPGSNPTFSGYTQSWPFCPVGNCPSLPPKV